MSAFFVVDILTFSAWIPLWCCWLAKKEDELKIKLITIARLNGCLKKEFILLPFNSFFHFFLASFLNDLMIGGGKDGLFYKLIWKQKKTNII